MPGVFICYQKSSTRHVAGRLYSYLSRRFGDEQVFFAESDEMGALMRELGVFPSASAARRAGRQGPIPDGWTAEFKASKKRRIWIWNPTE